ncbi:uncharacterized protein BROUX77_001622 [Berkeleyomyces rouxiae]|uniref:uncharacterized protein n=1 Tax=Berkeleyomyces rouxiae TaxID=2035830 RepID=UPI003B7BCFB8
MAPNTFSQPSQRSTRRAHRAGYTDHDDFDGLPVRQWREEWVKVAPSSHQQEQAAGDIWNVELLHGMPKDTSLLPTHSQELLRLARSGRLHKRPTPHDEGDSSEPATAADGTPENPEDDRKDSVYMTRVWKQLPRNAEDQPLSFLAKRHKGTVTIASKTIVDKPLGPTVTRATVRRLDAAGNPYTQEVTLQPGVPVDGEIISTRHVVLVSTAQVQEPAATEAPVVGRRRAPPPKRKPKGPGRGRKKKVIVEGAAPAGGAVAIPVSSGPGPTQPKTESANSSTMKAEDSSQSYDMEMADNSVMASDDEDDGDECDDDDGEDNDGDENQTPKPQKDTEMSDAQGHPTDSKKAPEAKVSSEDTQDDPSGAPVNAHLLVDPTPFESSPLRNVITLAPSPKSVPTGDKPQEDMPMADTEATAEASTNPSAPAEGEMQPEAALMNTVDGDVEMTEDIAPTASITEIFESEKVISPIPVVENVPEVKTEVAPETLEGSEPVPSDETPEKAPEIVEASNVESMVVEFDTTENKVEQNPLSEEKPEALVEDTLMVEPTKEADIAVDQSAPVMEETSIVESHVEKTEPDQALEDTEKPLEEPIPEEKKQDVDEKKLEAPAQNEQQTEEEDAPATTVVPSIDPTELIIEGGETEKEVESKSTEEAKPSLEPTAAKDVKKPESESEDVKKPGPESEAKTVVEATSVPVKNDVAKEAS